MGYIPHPVSRLFRVSSIYSVYYFELNRNYAEKTESHDFWELVYAEAGRVYLESDGETVYLQEGDLYLHRPNQEHRFRGNNIDTSRVFITSFACSCPEMLSFVGKTLRIEKDAEYLIRQIIRTAGNVFRVSREKDESGERMMRLLLSESAPPGSDQTVANLIELLLLQLCGRNRQRESFPMLSGEIAQDSLVSAVIGVLKENIGGTVSGKEIAARTHYSVSALSAAFRERTHFTVGEYHKILKLEQSGKLLRETEKSVREIAAELGFCNQHYFSTVFRKYMKTTPTEYRKSARSMIEKR